MWSLCKRKYEIWKRKCERFVYRIFYFFNHQILWIIRIMEVIFCRPEAVINCALLRLVYVPLTLPSPDERGLILKACENLRGADFAALVFLYWYYYMIVNVRFWKNIVSIKWDADRYKDVEMNAWSNKKT